MALGVDAGAAASVPVYLNQDFRVLWLSRTLGQTAANTVRFGSLIIVTQNTGSGWYASLLILAWMVPAVLGGLLSGVVVDVFAKRWILTVTNAVRAGVCLAFLATAQGTPEVYALVGLLAFLGPFIGPAESALVPTLVGRHELTSANALLNFMRYVAQAAGFALLAPLLMETLGTEAMIIVTAVLFAGAAIFAALIPVRRLGHDPHPSSPMNRPAGAAAVCARPCASSKRNPLSSAPPCISLARRDHAPPHGPLAVLPHRRLGPEGERSADRPGAGDRWDAAGPAPGLPLCPPSRRGLARDGRAAGVRRGAALAGLHRWPGCRPRPGDDRRPGRSRPPARPLLHLAVGHDRRFAHGARLFAGHRRRRRRAQRAGPAVHAGPRLLPPDVDRHARFPAAVARRRRPGGGGRCACGARPGAAPAGLGLALRSLGHGRSSGVAPPAQRWSVPP